MASYKSSRILVIHSEGILYSRSVLCVFHRVQRETVHVKTNVYTPAVSLRIFSRTSENFVSSTPRLLAALNSILTTRPRKSPASLSTAISRDTFLQDKYAFTAARVYAARCVRLIIIDFTVQFYSPGPDCVCSTIISAYSLLLSGHR